MKCIAPRLILLLSLIRVTAAAKEFLTEWRRDVPFKRDGPGGSQSQGLYKVSGESQPRFQLVVQCLPLPDMCK